ncbi:MAG: prenyltransferase/squalene oxidase repeat-containing protein [Planctomycetota bacterium]
MPQPPEPSRSAGAKSSSRLRTVQPPVESVDDGGVPAITSAEDSPESFGDHVRKGRREISSLLTSVIVHTILLICLALFVFTEPAAEVISVMAGISERTEPEFEQPMDDAQTIEVEMPVEEDISPLEEDSTELATDVELLTPEADNSQIEVPSEVTASAPVTNVAPMAVVQNLPSGGGLSGRNAEARARLAANHGGSEASEAAVERGLRWLIAHQDQDSGCWKLRHNDGECNGRCQNPGNRESTTAATGLSLLAFLGAGYTHREGSYQREVDAGLTYLIRKMRVTTHGGSLRESSMYDHAIATLALSEALIMTNDNALREYVELAMRYIVAAQHSRGGWRYVAGEPGDITVTGWMIMALKSCERAGVDVPPETLEKAEEFLESLSESDGSYYGYQAPDTAPVPTAVGQLCRMYLGWSRDKGQLKHGSHYLADLAPSPHDVYFNYYATQVLFHLQTDRWERWNLLMREHLIATQELHGHQEGSWYFEDQHGKVGGRLYTTAMCIMTLEVYYRYLPLYDSESLDQLSGLPVSNGLNNND